MKTITLCFNQRRCIALAVAVAVLVLAGCEDPTNGSSDDPSDGISDDTSDGGSGPITLTMSAAEVEPPGTTGTAFTINLYEETLDGDGPDKTSSVLELSLNHFEGPDEVPAGEYELDASNPSDTWYLVGYPAQQFQYVDEGSQSQWAATEGTLTVGAGSSITWDSDTVELNLKGELTVEPFPAGGDETTLNFDYDGTAVVDPD